MAAFNFPNSPSTNDLHTENSVTWKWDGVMWNRVGPAYTDTTNLNVTGIGTFAGAVYIAGMLTYEDVRNIDAIGIVTARQGIDVTSGSITIPDKIIHSGDTNTSIRFPAADTITAETAGSERLRITSAGLVGIGEASPSYTLDVKGDSGITQSPSSNSTAGQISIVGRNSGGSASAISRLKSYPDSNSSQSLFAIEIRNSSAAMVEALRIDSSGYVKLSGRNVQGSANGDKLLRIYQPSRTDAEEDVLLLQSYNQSSTSSIIIGGGDSSFNAATDISFRTAAINTTSGTERLRITHAGNVGMGTVTPHSSSTYKTFTISSGDGDGAQLALFGHGKNHYLWTDTSGLNFGAGYSGGGQLAFKTNGNNTRFHIAEGGDVVSTGALFADSDLWMVDKLRHTGDTDTAIRFAGADTVTIETGGSERLRINSSGYLKHTGLRAGNSENKLAILVTPSYNTSEEDVIVYQAENESGSNQLTIGGGTGSYNATTTLRFLTASAVNTTGGEERLRITSDGKLLVGHTSAYGSSNAQIFNTSQYLLDLSAWSADANGPTVDFYKSRNATVGSSTRVNSGDVVGRLRFLGNDGANSRTAVQITAEVDGTPGTNDMPGRLIFSTTPDDSSSITERFRIDSSGNVSLRNSTNNHQELQWYSGTSKSATIGWGNGSANWEFKHYRADNQADNPYANIDFFTGSTSSPTRALRITEDGNHIREKHSRFATRIEWVNAWSSAGDVLNFKSPHVNTGSDFDNGNNRYTAPVDGSYYFSFHTNVIENNSAGSRETVYFDFRKNGSSVTGSIGGRIYGEWTGYGWENICGHIMINLDEGDYIDMIHGRTGQKCDGNHYGQFVGWLVG